MCLSTGGAWSGGRGIWSRGCLLRGSGPEGVCSRGCLLQRGLGVWSRGCLLQGVCSRGLCLVETPGRLLLRAVRILPECILVIFVSGVDIPQSVRFKIQVLMHVCRCTSMGIKKKGSAVMLAVKRSAGVTLEVNPRNHASNGSTLVFET